MAEETKWCPGCERELPKSKFNIDRRSKTGRQNHCKECRNAYYKKNKDREIDRVLKWQRENKDKHYEKQKRWGKRNIEKVREIKRKAESARNQRKRENGGSFTKEEWKILCESVGKRCVSCGKKKKLTVDHIIPISEGGSSDISNIQPLCRGCNEVKGTNTLNYLVSYESRFRQSI